MAVGILDKLQRGIDNLFSPDLPSRILFFAKHRKVAFLCHFYKFFYGKISSSVPRFTKFRCDTRLAVRSHNLTTEIDSSRRKFSDNSLFTRTCKTLLRFLSFLITLKKLNTMEIVIFCLLELFSFCCPLFSIAFSLFLLPSVIPVHLSGFIAFLGRNSYRNTIVWLIIRNAHTHKNKTTKSK